MARLIIFIAVATSLISCTNSSDTLSASQISDVQNGVKAMADSISKQISTEGPISWLRYFENSPDFFMASDGQLVFPNIDTAKNFVTNTLVKTYKNIALHWSNIRVLPITTQFAYFSSVFHEDITYSDGNKLSTNGYFTGLAHRTSQGWKLENAHWSSLNAH